MEQMKPLLPFTASAGGVDTDAAAGKDVIFVGQVAVVSKTNEVDAISLSTNVGAAETISVTNTKGTSNNAINLSSVAGIYYEGSRWKRFNTGKCRFGCI